MNKLVKYAIVAGAAYLVYKALTKNASASAQIPASSQPFYIKYPATPQSFAVPFRNAEYPQQQTFLDTIVRGGKWDFINNRPA